MSGKTFPFSRPDPGRPADNSMDGATETPWYELEGFRMSHVSEWWAVWALKGGDYTGSRVSVWMESYEQAESWTRSPIARRNWSLVVLSGAEAVERGWCDPGDVPPVSLCDLCDDAE